MAVVLLVLLALVGLPVSVDELVRGTTIALRIESLDTCPAFDRDRNGGVAVDELVTAVNAALVGCATGPPLP